jgi:hypothetical protein
VILAVILPSMRLDASRCGIAVLNDQGDAGQSDASGSLEYLDGVP